MGLTVFEISIEVAETADPMLVKFWVAADTLTEAWGMTKDRYNTDGPVDGMGVQTKVIGSTQQERPGILAEVLLEVDGATT